MKAILAIWINDCSCKTSHALKTITSNTESFMYLQCVCHLSSLCCKTQSDCCQWYLLDRYLQALCKIGVSDPLSQASDESI